MNLSPIQEENNLNNNIINKINNNNNSICNDIDKKLDRKDDNNICSSGNNNLTSGGANLEQLNLHKNVKSGEGGVFINPNQNSIYQHNNSGSSNNLLMNTQQYANNNNNNNNNNSNINQEISMSQRQIGGYLNTPTLESQQYTMFDLSGTNNNNNNNNALNEQFIFVDQFKSQQHNHNNNNNNNNQHQHQQQQQHSPQHRIQSNQSTPSFSNSIGTFNDSTYQSMDIVNSSSSSQQQQHQQHIQHNVMSSPYQQPQQYYHSFNSIDTISNSKNQHIDQQMAQQHSYQTPSSPSHCTNLLFQNNIQPFLQMQNNNNNNNNNSMISQYHNNNNNNNSNMIQHQQHQQQHHQHQQQNQHQNHLIQQHQQQIQPQHHHQHHHQSQHQSPIKSYQKSPKTLSMSNYQISQPHQSPIKNPLSISDGNIPSPLISYSSSSSSTPITFINSIHQPPFLPTPSFTPTLSKDSIDDMLTSSLSSSSSNLMLNNSIGSSGGSSSGGNNNSCNTTNITPSLQSSMKLNKEPSLISLNSTTSFDSDKIGLKEKEEVARIAYKSWFVIKPGNKEVKDKWWSLYYNKILPKFHLRDNHLGRKINQWIEEDMKELEKKQGGPVQEVEETVITTTNPTDSSKKRKPNSTKEGTQPAYINVQLVNPDPNNDKDNIKSLAECCVNKSIYWTELELESLITVFKDNRVRIMDNIISQTKKKSNSSSNLTSPNTTPSLLSSPIPTTSILSTLGINSNNNNSNNNNNNNNNNNSNNTIIYGGGDSPVLKHSLTSSFKTTNSSSPSKKHHHHHKKNKTKLNESNASFTSNCEWINGEIDQLNDFYWVKLDLPGVEPSNISIKTDEATCKILVSGEKIVEESKKILATTGKRKYYGSFDIEASLPNNTNVSKSEHFFLNGTLSIKSPIISSTPLSVSATPILTNINVNTTTTTTTNTTTTNTSSVTLLSSSLPSSTTVVPTTIATSLTLSK